MINLQSPYIGTKTNNSHSLPATFHLPSNSSLNQDQGTWWKRNHRSGAFIECLWSRRVGRHKNRYWWMMWQVGIIDHQVSVCKSNGRFFLSTCSVFKLMSIPRVSMLLEKITNITVHWSLGYNLSASSSIFLEPKTETWGMSRKTELDTLAALERGK